MINPVNVAPKTSGGGLWGHLTGGMAKLVGLAAAPFTGGVSIPIGEAVGTAAEVGSSLADKQKVTNPTPLQTFGQNDPGVQLAQLLEAKKSALQLPKTQQDVVVPHLDNAIGILGPRV